MDEVKAESRELRKLAQKHGGDGGYPRWYRERAGRYAVRRRREGAKWSTIASEIGVTEASVSQWMRANLEGRPCAMDVDPVGWSSEQEVLRGLLQRPRNGRGLPKSVQLQLRTYVASRRGEGVTWKTLAAELGVGRQTLQYWCRDKSPRRETGNMVPVVIEEPMTVETAAQPVEALTLVTPKGFRIEGLSLAQLLQLLGAL